MPAQTLIRHSRRRLNTMNQNRAKTLPREAVRSIRRVGIGESKRKSGVIPVESFLSQSAMGQLRHVGKISEDSAHL